MVRQQCVADPGHHRLGRALTPAGGERLGQEGFNLGGGGCLAPLQEVAVLGEERSARRRFGISRGRGRRQCVNLLIHDSMTISGPRR